MSHTKKRHLILEKLEERIFLDANPVAVAADGVDPTDVDMLETADVQTAQQAAEEQTPAESTDDTQETESLDNGISDEPVLETEGEADSQIEPTEQDKSDDTVDSVETAAAVEVSDDTEELPQNQESELALTETAAEPETIEQVIFVDSTVTDHETLVDGVVSDLEQRDADDSSTEQTTSGTTVVILDGATDQVQQITDTLSSYSQLTGVHIISHGSENSLQLGDTLLDTSNIEEYESQLSLWGDALSEEGDILLYGCNIAENVSEENFIEALAEITGADVAASDDPTGNAASGGDWELEVATGDIETEVLKDATGEWDGLLDPTPFSSGSASNDNPMINSQFSFTISFDNSSTTDGDVGYGPFVDVVVPNAIQVSDVEIFELGVSPEIYTWDGTQWVSDLGDDGVLGTADDTIITEHPGQTDGPDPWPELAMPTATNAGDKWYYIVQPFGSFTPDQPIVDVVFTATANTADGAVVGTDYDITHRAGFLYGDTADNQNGPIQEASEGTITITPQVIDIEKTTTIGEDQTVTGPNYPVKYTLTVNVAAGETVSGVVIEDYLAENAVYRGDVILTNLETGEVTTPETDASIFTEEPDEWTVLGSNSSERLLQLTLGNLSGIADGAENESTEYQITYSVYFAETQSDGSTLLPTVGGDDTVLNESSISGTYTYPDNTEVDVTNGSDDPLGALNDVADDSATPSDVETEITSITAKKSVSTIDPDTGTEGVDPVPGTILEYSVQVSVSDYYEAGNIVVADEFGDGQTLLTSSDGYGLTVTVHEENAAGDPETQTYNLDGYYTVGAVDTDDGSTPLTFNISDLLLAETGDGTLTGAAFDGDIEGADSDSDPLNEDRRSGDATYVTITFFTQIDDNYDYLQNSGTSDASIDLGDSISNDVTVTANITDTDGATAPQDDTSATSLTIEGGEVNKEIYAINGFLLDKNNQWSEDGGLTYYDLDTNGVLPGDLVTYHITIDLPLADFENLFITDFLPFPVYDVTEINTNTADDFDGVIDMTAGEVEFGPDHNLNGSYISGLQHDGSDAGLLNTDNAPIVDATNSSANNAVTFDFGSYDAPAATSDAVTIDLLLTVTISDEPMVDGLPLTNQVVTSINDTTNEVFQDDDIIQVQLNQPELSIVKGAVQTDNDAGIFSDNATVDNYFTESTDTDFRLTSTTNGGVITSEWLDSESGSGPDLDTDLSGVDAGDTVTYAIIIENTGGGPAYDLVLSDALPTGYTFSDVSNFYISYGDGTEITSFEDSATWQDFFGTGIELTDPTGGVIKSQDSDRDGDLDDTDNIIVVTYDLVVATSVQPLQTLTNTASIENYAGANEGAEHLDDPLTDDADVTVQTLSVAKELTDTGETSTDGNNVVIGETVTYTVSITVPEGSADNVILTDTLASGLAIVSIDSISLTNTAVSGAVTSSEGTWAEIVTASNNSLASPGETFTIDFGTLTNSESDNDDPETIVITYTAVVLNDANNNDGDARNNSATLTWTGADPVTDMAPNVVIREPDLQVNKQVLNPETGTFIDADNIASALHLDEGDTITYSITIEHSGSSSEDAFDVVFEDTLPTNGIDWSTGTVTIADGSVDPTSWDSDITDGDFSGAIWEQLGYTDSTSSEYTTFIFAGGVLTSAVAGQEIDNTGSITWTSLDDDLDPSSDATTPYNDAGFERTGDESDPGGSANTYSTEDSAYIVVEGSIDKVVSPTEYTIGDEVEYFIKVTLPEGDTNGLIVTDQLPDGLQYVSGSATIYTEAGDSDPSGLLVQDFSGNGWDVQTFSVTGGASDGDDIQFQFNSNPTDDAIILAGDGDPLGENDEFVIGFKVIVTNIIDNYGDNPSTTDIDEQQFLTNQVSMSYLAPDSSTVDITDPDPPDIGIIEPQISAQKQVSTSEDSGFEDVLDAGVGVEAGDTLYYQVTLTNTGHSTAYETEFNDTLAQGTSFGDIVSAQINSTGDASLGTNISTETVGDITTITFTNDDWDMDVGDVLVVTYSATVTNSAVIDGDHTNTVDADWSSQDGNPVDGDGNPIERDYDDQGDYAVDGDQDEADAVFIIPEATISKDDGGVETATIGDTIIYTLRIDSPEGTLNDMQVQDILSAGLIYNGDAQISTDGGTNFTELTPAQSASNDGSADVTLTWNMGNYEIDTDEIILIQYTATVANVVTNQDGDPEGNTLNNQVTLTYTDVNGDTVTDAPPEADNTDSFTVVEPQISAQKQVSTSEDSGFEDVLDAGVGVEAGDTLYYQVTLTNTGHSTAYETEFNDTLAQGTSFGDIVSAQINSTGDASPGTNISTETVGDITTITFTNDDWDLDVGDVLVVTYSATVTNSAVIDGDHTNVVDADWTSQDGNPVDGDGNPIERDYDDQGDYAVDGDQDEADAVFTIPEATISKDDGGVETATIGDTITYTLRIDSPEGTLNDMQVQDILSAGLIYNGDAQISTDGGTNFTELTPAQSASNDGSADVTLTWNIGNYEVDTDEIILIQYTATVANVVTNQDGDPEGNTLNNQVTLTYTDVNGDTVTDAPPEADNTDSFTVVEPQITTEKTVSDPPTPDAGVQPNDVLTYTITLENTGSADAYEVTAEDILPDGVILYTDTAASDYIAPAASGTDDITINDNGDGTLFITNSSGEGWDIAQGASVVITYQVQVKGAAYVVGAHTNYVDADWTGQDGDPTTSGGIERVYDDGETQELWTGVDGNQDEATADFITQVNPPVVGDFVWFDVNGDGVQDAGEPGISGVEINLYGNDGNGNTVLFATAVTDDNGWYEFDHLPLTNNEGVPPYLIQVDTDTLPDGLAENQTAEKADALKPGSSQAPESGLNNQTYFDVLTTADNILDIDFGYTASGTIGDTVWYDTNLNGLQDETGTGITGAEVTLQGDLDGDGIFDYTATTTTDSNGEYSFTNLPFVDYEVTVTSLPGGLSLQTGDPDATLDSRHEVTLSDTTPAVDTVDFGYVGSGSIGDTVWANNNGDDTVDAGESGLANVEVILTGDVNFDGILDTFTTFTDGNGNYSFTNLPEGDYTVTVNTSTLPGGLTAAGANYDLDGGNDSTTVVTLAAGENVTDADFGFGDSDYGSIGDTVWLDLDGDGTQDAGNEIGLSEVTVNLIDDTGTIIDTATTDADGSYFFGSLPYGDYTIEVDNTSLPDGLTQTYDLTGAQDDHSATVTIDATQQNWDTVDFGYQGDGSIGDLIWLDLDGDSTQDVAVGDDFGLANVDVTLEIDIDGDGDYDTTMTTTTDGNGFYEFTGLPYTTYKVIIDTDDLPEGVDLIADPDSGTMGDVPNESILTLTSDDPTNDSQDFGYQGTGSIGDTVWKNINGDNSSDGETGINDVEVTLTGDFNNDGVVSDNESITVTTGNNGTDDGQYLFENLPEGEYTVTVDTTDPNLSGLNPNYDADGGNDATTEVTLAAGESNTDVDFGFGDSDKGSIGDTIWLDVDGDGVQDPTEVGIAGVTVYLYDGTDTSENGTFVTTTTDADGHYYFGDLDINTYTVVVDNTTLPNGVFQTYDPDGARDHSYKVTLDDSLDDPITNIDTVDFGYRGQGEVGDTIWLDLDNNGEPNVGAGDFGLANVDVTLTVNFIDTNGDETGSTATFTTTTDAQGRYQFDGLPYGNYTVTVDSSDLPAGVSPTVDPDGDTSNEAKFVLDETAPNNLDQDFGYRGEGSIGDTIWQNNNGDANVDTDESPLSDVSVILTADFNNDGVIDPTEQLRVTTDDSGQYDFSGLPYGNYTVTVDSTTLPEGFSPNYDADGQLDSSTEVTLDSETPSTDSADFGYTTVADIGDTVWFDYDGDGVQDADEPGLAGVTVTLTDEDGNTFIDSTDENGNYLFTALDDGTYAVTVDTSTLPTTGLEPTADLDGITTANSATLTLENGQSNMDVDFGYTGTGSVGDTLWNDENQNGVQDGGEAGLPGVEITVGIDLDGDNTPDYTVTTTTDSNGNYLIDNLPAGSHIVTVDPATLPEGITPSFDPDGTLDNSFTVTLNPGQNVDTVDFGYVYPPKSSPAPFAPVAPLPVTPSKPDTTLTVDAYLLNYLFGGERGDIFDYFQREWDETYQPQILPVAPIYSGRAEPGTTLALTLLDAEGNELSSQSVMADTAGNWIANFSGSLLYDVPHQMVIKQSISSYNNSTQGLFNMRTHFNPTFASLVFSDIALDVNTIMASLPSTIIKAIHDGNNQTLNLHWDNFAGYEFFTSSTNPSQHSH